MSKSYPTEATQILRVTLQRQLKHKKLPYRGNSTEKSNSFIQKKETFNNKHNMEKTIMTETELDNWFCSLTVKQKEHIACKVLMRSGEDTRLGLYPNCSDVWTVLHYELKYTIYDHCTDHHGMWIQEGGDAPIFSY